MFFEWQAAAKIKIEERCFFFFKNIFPKVQENGNGLAEIIIYARANARIQGLVTDALYGLHLPFRTRSTIKDTKTVDGGITQLSVLAARLQ